MGGTIFFKCLETHVDTNSTPQNTFYNIWAHFDIFIPVLQDFPSGAVVRYFLCVLSSLAFLSPVLSIEPHLDVV